VRVIVGMQHPKHFWMFKNLILAGRKKGWNFLVLAAKKDILEELLSSSDFNYCYIGENQPTLIKKIIEYVKYLYKTYYYSRKFRPDVFIGQAFVHFALISKIHRLPFIIYEDTEDASILHNLTIPFCKNIITPNYFTRNLGRKQIRIKSIFEFAYLHPNYFKPNSETLNLIGIGNNEKFVIIRFISWQAHHDFGQKRFTTKTKIEMIKKIEKYAKVFISSEGILPNKLKKYKIILPPTKMHDVLYYAALYIGESPTMTAESAILGTPSICLSSWAKELGNIKYLGKTDLIKAFKTDQQELALAKALEWLKNKKIKEKWQTRLNIILKNNIDVTSDMVDRLSSISRNYY